MGEVEAGTVRTADLKRELAAALALHLPPHHIEHSLHSLWDFAHKQLDKWRESNPTQESKKEPGSGASGGVALVRCARLLSGFGRRSSKL